MPKIVIDYEKCLGCGSCVEECTVRLLAEESDEEGKNIIRPRSDRVDKTETNGHVFVYFAPGCSNCRVCIITCPSEAIDVIPELARKPE